MKNALFYICLLVMSLFSCTFGPPARFAPNVDFSGTELPLAEAIYENNKSKLRELLENKTVDINQPSKSGLTYLTYAILCDHYNAAQILLENGADPNLLTVYSSAPTHATEYMLPLEVACGSRHKLKLMKLLVEHGAKLNDGRAKLPLGRAIYARDMEKVKYLLQAGADINKKDYDTYPPVETAAFKREWDMVEFLIDNGADPMGADEKGNTAVFWIQRAIDNYKGNATDNIMSYNGALRENTWHRQWNILRRNL